MITCFASPPNLYGSSTSFTLILLNLFALNQYIMHDSGLK